MGGAGNKTLLYSARLMEYYSPLWTRKRDTASCLSPSASAYPLLTLPFLSGYSKEKGVPANLYGVAIDLQKGPHDGAYGPEPIDPHHKAPAAYARLIPKRIPFRFFLVFTLIFLYMGIVRIDRARRREQERAHGFGPPG